MSGAAPADGGGRVADERLVLGRQADGDDVLLEHHVLAQLHHRQVVLEVRWVVFGVHLRKLRCWCETALQLTM